MAFDFDAARKLAPATLAAIERAVERGADNAPRPHLGASQIGKPCERALWYDFHWCTPSSFAGRMLRLFARGQREEDTFTRLLRDAGVTVHTVDARTGQQYSFKALGGHFGGSMDGACVGLPDAPKAWHVLEYKTHNAKSFAALQAHGVAKAKPEHAAQMQCYMGWTGMHRALYLAVNKDNDDLYLERMDFDDGAFQALLAKAQRAIFADRPPERIGGPDWWQCKLCHHSATCHQQEAPAVNCRTCTHATAEQDGTWSCDLHSKTLSVPEQRQGCAAHRYNPYLLHWAEWVDANAEANTVTYRLGNGTFTNGAAPHGVSSAEIRAAKDKNILAMDNSDSWLAQLRGEFGAEIVG